MTQYICINQEDGIFTLGNTPEEAYNAYDETYGKNGEEQVYELGNQYLIKTVFERVNDEFEGVRIKLRQEFDL
jgi:hypothetical protein